VKTLLYMASVSLCLTTLAPAAESKWQELKLKHFIIHYAQDAAFAKRVGRKAESYYDSIMRDLGMARHDGFWLWDRRARIVIYPNHETFVKGTRAPSWAAGKAVASERLIATYRGSDEFLDSVLPHEMTHLIFNEFLGFEREVPLWLNEGVAQWEDQLNRKRTLAFVLRLHAGGKLMPLSELTRLDVRKVKARGQAATFYAQSVSLVGFLIEKYGSRRFRQFCGHLRDGKTLDEALRFTYPGQIRNIEALEQVWHRHLEDAT
jgi:hypothetical protein